MQSVGTQTAKSDTECEIESNFALKNPYVQSEEALAVVLLYFVHVFSPLCSPSIKNFEFLFFKISKDFHSVHSCTTYISSTKRGASCIYILDSRVGGRSKADIHVRDTRGRNLTQHTV